RYGRLCHRGARSHAEAPATGMKVGWGSIALFATGFGALAPSGCSTHDGAPPAQLMTRAELLDPKTCNQCHTLHYDDWARSMHAYASKDPVFLAMNARGQRETGGKLGDFCVKCHAPMAVRDGMTTDGLNLASLPEVYQQGVTCFFCHSIESVGGEAGAALDNSAVNLASDRVMRGEYPNTESAASAAPLVANSAHASMYSPLHDSHKVASASMCGACHDITAPPGGKVERTFFEWSHSAYAGSGGSTCAADGCHMTAIPGTAPIAMGAGFSAPSRQVHEHDFPGVDVALDPAFTGAAIEQGFVQQKLNSETLQGAVCVTNAGAIRVILDDVAVGHQWPSGSAQDRRAWVEVKAYKAGALIYQSGVVPDGGTPTDLTNDPDLWMLRDCMFGADGGQVDMFWQAASTEGDELPALGSFSGLSSGAYNHRVQLYPRSGAPIVVSGSNIVPDDVKVRVRIQPVGLDVLRDLAGGGYLDAGVAANMPIFDVSLTGPVLPGDTDGGTFNGLEWTPSTATIRNGAADPYGGGGASTCVASTSAFTPTGALATNHTKCSP
ncbi:MAG: multiheme c-type cytochrome, partial [Polyangiaceae bacterium]